MVVVGDNLSGGLEIADQSDDAITWCSGLDSIKTPLSKAQFSSIQSQVNAASVANTKFALLVS